jgi:hypothetical protein
VRSILPTTVMDSHLKLTRANVPAAANGIYSLQKAADKLWWPDDEERKIIDAAYAKLYEETREMGEGLPMGNPSIPKAVMDSSNQKNERVRNYLLNTTNWDAALAATVLNNNRETLAAWDEACALPDFQMPPASELILPYNYLTNWKRLAHLAVVRENFLMHAGQEKAAFDQMVNHFLLGRKIQASGTPLMGYLVGSAIKNLGLTQIQNWLGRSHLSPRDLRELVRKLDPDDESVAFATATKAEYQFTINTMEAIYAGKINSQNMGAVWAESGKMLTKPISLWPVYNRSQTRALFAKGYSVLVKAAAQPYAEVKLQTQLPEFFSYRGPVSLIFSGNMAGQVMYKMTMPAVTGSLAKKSQDNVNLQATRTILALRAYQLTHGKLPPDLNVLAPQFLLEVPVDDFDGKPLRYLAEKKMVYSVGKNLKDDGGDDRKGEGVSRSDTHLDIVSKFDF